MKTSMVVWSIANAFGSVKQKKYLLIASIALLGIILTGACAKHFGFRTLYNDANKMLHETENLREKPFLKAHLKNGDVCIFQAYAWRMDTVTGILSGYCTKYDFNRFKISEGLTDIHIDSVAIFESNQKISTDESGRIAALAVLTGLDILLGVYCAANPKACFGSCPTFYLGEDKNVFYSDAEGFSNAISPSLEYADIDALNNARLSDQTVSLKMKNEAFETHVVNDVKLYACPRRANEKVYQTCRDEFYLTDRETIPLKTAECPEGNCTRLLKENDKIERFSLSDPDNLSTREELFLTFDNDNFQEDAGLVISFRQTLMTTYLIYSAIGYMGDDVGNFFAKMERDGLSRKKLNGIYNELGKIEAYVWKNNQWEKQDSLYETGPIAFNTQIIRIQGLSDKKNLRIKLVLNKGLWRIDYAGLAKIKRKAEPLVLPPSGVAYKDTAHPEASNLLTDPDKYLISMPGDVYTINFTLPREDQDYELFLYSKGYYLEWVRASWLRDKNLPALRKMIENPAKYLRNEAAAYKRYESEMEEQFWNSKISAQNFSYHEK